MLDTVREVSTPELVALHLRLAGPVPRALAWLIDMLLRGAAYIGAAIALQFLGKLGMGLMLILVFLLEWFYPVLFEVLARGATPGKRALGLVVLNDNGTPVGWGPSLVRNLLRAADFLPFAYGLGLVTMLCSSEFRRLGDVLAGTVVVHRERLPERKIPEHLPIVPLTHFSRDAQRAVLAYAERAPQLTPERLAELASFAPQLTREARDMTPAAYLLGVANYLFGRRT